MKRYTSLILACIFFIAGYPWPAFAAKKLSVAVAPANSADETSADAASALRSALTHVTDHHIIDRDIVKQVVDYHGEGRQDMPVLFSPAMGHLSRAQEHYFNMRYEEACAEIARAVQMLEGSGAALHERGQVLFDALMSQAMIAKAIGDDALMASAIGRAARLSPGRELDRAAYPPSAVKLFAAQRAQLASNGAGELAVKTNPAVAEVYLNGIMRGVTPLTLHDLPAGDYALMIKTNRYRPVMKTVSVAPGQTKSVSERLNWTGNAGRGGSRTYGALQGREEIATALSVADLMKADRTVLVSAEERGDRGGYVRARVVDRTYRAAFRPVVARYDASNRDEAYAELTDELIALLGRDIATDPGAYADPQGTADPMLLGKNRKKFYRQPLFWGAIGTAIAGAVAGGVVAALSGGSDDGSVRVKFK